MTQTEAQILELIFPVYIKMAVIVGAAVIFKMAMVIFGRSRGNESSSNESSSADGLDKPSPNEVYVASGYDYRNQV
jgi:hypothetical protein